MPYDLLIKNGTVADGTGAASRQADVAVSAGRIAAIGKVDGSARQTIDAADCVVAPGFIDPHTHYDAQICWDAAVTPSPWHGVTSVVMGNDIPEGVRDTLRKAAPLIKRGARPQTSPLPLTREVNMRNPFSFAPFPSWGRVFADQSKSAQAAVYGDRALRDQFREDPKRPLTFGNWSRLRVHEVRSPALKQFEGQTIADIAKAQGKDGVDAFLDLTLQDDLEIEFTLSTFNHRVDRMKEILGNPDILMV